MPDEPLLYEYNASLSFSSRPGVTIFMSEIMMATSVFFIQFVCKTTYVPAIKTQSSSQPRLGLGRTSGAFSFPHSEVQRKGVDSGICWEKCTSLHASRADCTRQYGRHRPAIPRDSCRFLEPYRSRRSCSPEDRLPLGILIRSSSKGRCTWPRR